MAFELAPVGQPATVQTISRDRSTPVVSPTIPGIPGGGTTTPQVARGVGITLPGDIPFVGGTEISFGGTVPGGGSFAPDLPSADPCAVGFRFDPILRTCVPIFNGDATPGATTPAERSVGIGGLALPARVCRDTLVCPTFADGKTGILWMNAITGQVVCLPRRTSGKGFGLIRKNKPRRKAFISAAQKRSLDSIKRVQDKAKSFATDAGFICRKR